FTGGITGTTTLALQGETLGLNNDADANNLLKFGSAAGGAASGDLYWGSSKLCESSDTSCGWLTSADHLWQLNAGALSPFSLTADLNLGATATSSAKISLAGSLDRGKAVAIFNQTEAADILTASSGGSTRMTLDTSGNLTLGLAGTQQGGLVLANTSAFTTTIRSSNSSAESYTLTLPTTNGSPNEVLQTDGAGATSWVAQTGGANFWQINEGALSPFSLTADFNLGATATSSAKLSIAGSLDRGKAAMILNQTENQDIFTASSAGVQRFRLDNTGNLFVYDTTGADYLSLGHDGTDANILTNAGNINIGSGGGDLILGVNTTTPVGILFTESDQIYATGGETITISDLANVTPDATDQYDLGSDTLIWNQVFTNQICFDGSSDCMTSSAVGKWQENLGALSPYSLTADLLLGSTASSSARIDLAGSLTRGRAAAIINQTENQDIFTASAGGTPRFTIDTNGYVKIGTQTVLSTRGGTGNFFAGTDAPSAGSNDQYNTALGINALDSLNNSTGIHNTALGYSALTALTSGDYNTAIGSTALGSLNGGSKNTVIGYNALNLSTGASQNTVMGNSAAYRMGSSGSDNLILGYQAAYGVDTNYTNSNNNVFLGSQTAYNITSNSLGNVMMGHQSGYNMEAGADYNVFLGYNSGYYELGSNKLVIENTNSLTPLVFGDFNLDYFGVNGMLGVGNATPMPLHLPSSTSIIWVAQLPARPCPSLTRQNQTTSSPLHLPVPGCSLCPIPVTSLSSATPELPPTCLKSLPHPIPAPNIPVPLAL
ncbi:MAG: hypothetical protein UX91_C0014G0009, partial [Candidatus Amesbacteria bacterium GW2011_GWB1_47_19]